MFLLGIIDEVKEKLERGILVDKKVIEQIFKEVEERIYMIERIKKDMEEFLEDSDAEEFYGEELEKIRYYFTRPIECDTLEEDWERLKNKIEEDYELYHQVYEEYEAAEINHKRFRKDIKKLEEYMENPKNATIMKAYWEELKKKVEKVEEIEKFIESVNENVFDEEVKEIRKILNSYIDEKGIKRMEEIIESIRESAKNSVALAKRLIKKGLLDDARQILQPIWLNKKEAEVGLLLAEIEEKDGFPEVGAEILAEITKNKELNQDTACLLYTSPSPRD